MAARADRHALGVLFVHGIGEQHQGDTLLRCADPLVEWLRRWSAQGGSARPPELVHTELSPEEGTPPFGVLAGSMPSDDQVDWIMAESWWSQTFRPPGPMTVAPWVWSVGKRLGQRQIRNFFGRQERTIREFHDVFARRFGVAARLAFYVFWLPLLLAFFVVGPFFGWFVLAAIRIAALVGTLALVPLSVIPPLRPLVRRAQLAVANGVGDSWVLKCSPTSVEAMVSRVERDLRWLEDRAEVVAIVAYSQGAVVAHRALARRPAGRVRLFLTFGSALRLHYSEHEGRRTGREPLWWRDLAPRGPVKWFDYYTEWDLVAGGPVWRRRKHDRRSDPVANLNSVLSDHRSYWDNGEQVVANIARGLLSLTGARITHDQRDRDALQLADLRRTNRVALLTAGRWLYLAGAGTALVFLLPGSLQDVGRWCVDALQGTLFFILGGLGTRLGNELEGTVAHYLLGGIAVTAGVGLLYRLLVVTVWNRWSDTALDRMFDRETEGHQSLQRALFGLTWLVVPAGLFALWSMAGDDTWVSEFRASQDYPGMDLDAIAWIYAAVLFLEYWWIMMFIKLCSLDRPPRPLRDPSELRQGKTYALFDYREGQGIRCCRAVVRRIGDTQSGRRIPVIHAPAEERITVQVVQAAPERTAGGDRQYEVGDEVVLQGTGRLSRWDEYEAWVERRQRVGGTARPRRFRRLRGAPAR